MPRIKKVFGFTLIEVLIVAPIVMLVIGAFIASIVNLTGSVLAESERVKLMNDTQLAFDKIESDIKMSGAYLARNNMAITAPQGFNDSTEAFLNASVARGDVLILNSFVTTENPLKPTRALVNLANMPNACGSTNFGQNQIMTMNIVYFVKDNSLWRRVLATNGYASKACVGATIWQRPSCSPGITGALCVTSDEKLLTVVGDLTLTINYFATAADISPVPNAIAGSDTVRQAALDGAKTVQVTITANSSAAGHDFTQEGSVRVTRAGSLVKYATPI